jgi:protein gp37
MGDNSKIEWTEATWNPVAGCAVVSPGCTNCYAMKMAARLEAMGQPLYRGLTKPSKAGPVWRGTVRANPDALLAPLKRKKPTTYFVNSMSDLFYELFDDELIDRVFAVMALCPQHTFQVLTKRADRMRTYFNGPYPDGNGVCARIAEHTWALAPDRKQLPVPPVFVEVPVGPRLPSGEPEFGWRRMMHPKAWPLPNVWLGVSAEDQRRADERIPHLLQTPAAVRFVSAEPLLGPIDLTSVVYRRVYGSALVDSLRGKSRTHHGDPLNTGEPTLDWVIVGGESGPNARPMHPDWARTLRDQCAAAGVPFFFKQWGAWASVHDVRGANLDAFNAGRGDFGEWHGSDGFVPQCVCGSGHGTMSRVGKKAAGRLLDGIEHNAMPEVRG